jgi:hypothetical protein
MSTSLITSRRKYEKPATQQPLAPGEIQGVFFTISPDMPYEQLLAKIESWFDGRSEVIIVDFGTSDKLDLGYIMIEWLGYEVDDLFIAILRDEDLIEDYTVYTRED